MSRQGLPVRTTHNTASTKRRLFSPLRPGSPGLPRQCASICAHWASVSTSRSIVSLNHTLTRANNPDSQQALGGYLLLDDGDRRLTLRDLPDRLRQEFEQVVRLRQISPRNGRHAAAHGVSRECRQAERRESQLDNGARLFSDGLCQSPGCLKDAGKGFV